MNTGHEAITFRKRHDRCHDAYINGELAATIFRDPDAWIAQDCTDTVLLVIGFANHIRDAKRMVTEHFFPPEAQGEPSNEHPRAVKPVLIAALALLLAAPAAAHATAPPPGCQIAGTTSEGFPVAQCSDGRTVYADMDGAGGYNSGLPYVVPGTWVELP
jgi:hypothetical protein